MLQIDDIRAGIVVLPMRAPMKSTGLSVKDTFNVIVSIRCDSVEGQGASLSFSPGHASAVYAMVKQLSTLLVGQDPRQPREHWSRMRSGSLLTAGHGVDAFAIAALDTALWDLHARLLGVPLHRLFGAAPRSIPVYTQPGWLSLSLDALVAEATAAQEAGFGLYKMRVGSEDLATDLDRVSAVREALPVDVGLLLDANQAWSRAEASRALQALTAFDLKWVEEPLDSSDAAGMAELRRRFTIPLAAGENSYGPEGIHSLITGGCVDVVTPDLQHCGGVTGFMKALELGNTWGLTVANHLFLESSIHVLTAFHGAVVAEYMPGWWDDLYEEQLHIEGGVVHPGPEPGLGRRIRADHAKSLESLA